MVFLTAPARLLLCAAGLAAFACLVVGLTKTVAFERTPAQVADERTGRLLVLLGCLVLLALAAVAWRAVGGWVAVAIATPAMASGGLTLLAGGTLLPQLVALPACGVALAGLCVLLLGRGR